MPRKGSHFEFVNIRSIRLMSLMAVTSQNVTKHPSIVARHVNNLTNGSMTCSTTMSK